uniref:Dynein regulatory complex protein 10 n=1 Tax=Percolomonas cosmopolitus TaxID=63605 RepID=A0A7S1KPG5_9EUKA|mmetsp:Transcript_1697/g.5957  ORF Transcript_1697/g.5957 Transcript_1697/m.5957 type:complete len:405 (+) Transcript_1697:181-1395(+)
MSLSANQNEITRILNVINQLISQISILQYLPPYGSLSQKSLRQLSENAIEALESMLESETELNQMVNNQGGSGSGNVVNNASSPLASSAPQSPSQSQQNTTPSLQINQSHKHNLAQIQDITEKTRQRVREVCFQFEKCQWRPVEGDQKSSTMARYLDVLLQYKSILMDNLHTTVEEEESRREVRNATTTRENKATADVKALNRELDSERAARGREMDQRTQDVKKLFSEIQLLKENEDAERAATTERLAQKENQKQEEFNQMKAYLQRQIQNIAEALQKKKEENQQLELKMRVMRKNSETKVGSVVQKYDQFMSETTEKLQQLREDFESDSKRVEFLEQELCDFEQKKNESEKSDAERCEILRRNLLKAQAYVNAKVVISRAWQSYKKRNAGSKKKGRKGKKKG